MALDPYRVLGLPPGSSAADVKRAYRQLAKANHPDSAGASALPRFLEIQRAYETLTASTWRPGMRRPAPAASSEPWRAEPNRARSTPGATPPGADPAAERGRARGSASTRGREGPAGDAARGATGSPAGGRSRPGAESGPRPGAGSGTGARPGGGQRAAGSERPDGSTGRRRASRKATFGSTSYDEAKESTDTRWAGASWYGPSSGEYWRVNPREYADPRKHGPEYLAKAAARAARAAERRAQQEGTAAGPLAPEDDGLSAPEPAAGSRDPETGSERMAGAAGRDQPPASSRDWSSRAERERQAGTTAGWAATSPAGAATAGRAWTPPRHDGAWRARPEAEGMAAAAAAGGSGGRPADDWGLGFPTLTLGPGLRRLLRALIAWPPLGIAAAALIGEATGCAAFEATCAAPADLYPWAAQGVIILALLALPAIARILAGGTIAVLVLAFPVAAVLSASGASYDRTYGPAALLAVLAIAWGLGVGAVLLRRAVTRSIP